MDEDARNRTPEPDGQHYGEELYEPRTEAEAIKNEIDWEDVHAEQMRDWRDVWLSSRELDFRATHPPLLVREDLVDIASSVVAIFGGTRGVRDETALEAVIRAADGLAQDLYSRDHAHTEEHTFHLAAAYTKYMTAVKPFNDQNATIGLYAALTVLEANYRTTEKLDPWYALDLTWKAAHERVAPVAERVETLASAEREALVKLFAEKTGVDRAWSDHRAKTVAEKSQLLELWDRPAIVREERARLFNRSEAVRESRGQERIEHRGALDKPQTRGKWSTPGRTRETSARRSAMEAAKAKSEKSAAVERREESSEQTRSVSPKSVPTQGASESASHGHGRK